jgi:hypothetical protein
MAFSRRVKNRIRHNKVLRLLRLQYKTKNLLAIAFLEQSKRTDNFGDAFYPVATSEITQPSDSNTVDLELTFPTYWDQHAIDPVSKQ